MSIARTALYVAGGISSLVLAYQAGKTSEKLQTMNNHTNPAYYGQGFYNMNSSVYPYGQGQRFLTYM